MIANFDLIILFFVLGVFASWIKSDLEVPEAISKFLSIFLLLSLGLKGGHEVRFAQDLLGFWPALTIGLFTCTTIPLTMFFAFRQKLGVANAAALAASYGSVSAVTFIAAQGFLENKGTPVSGYLVAVMALMEVPAILMGVFLYEKFRNSTSSNIKTLLKLILSTKSFVLLIGGFIIGLLMNQTSWNGISPVIQGGFKGILVFFLLDLGIVAQKQLREAWKFKRWIALIAILMPLFFGSLSLLLGIWWGLAQGDQIILAVLAGSASYIAAPATLRSTVPEANPGLYMALPLAITFPVNLIFGISFYVGLSELFQS